MPSTPLLEELQGLCHDKTGIALIWDCGIRIWLRAVTLRIVS